MGVPPASDEDVRRAICRDIAVVPASTPMPAPVALERVRTALQASTAARVWMHASAHIRDVRVDGARVQAAAEAIRRYVPVDRADVAINGTPWREPELANPGLCLACYDGTAPSGEVDLRGHYGAPCGASELRGVRVAVRTVSGRLHLVRIEFPPWPE